MTVFEDMHQHSDDGSIWTVVLDTRRNSAKIRLECATAQSYIQGMMLEFRDVESLLRIVAEGDCCFAPLNS